MNRFAFDRIGRADCRRRVRGGRIGVARREFGEIGRWRVMVMVGYF